MRRATLAALGLVAALAAGCDDFITGSKLTENPNSPIDASALQLLVAAQASMFNMQEGQLARLAAMYTQQLAGTNNQQLAYGSHYLLTEGDLNNFWTQIYVGGGLHDLRTIQAKARASDDQRLLGIALVLEALRIGTATSLWGDIPYSEAADPATTTPRLDAQQAIYASVQAKLDTAIAALAAAPAGQPTLAQDVIYRGNVTRWSAAAHTLKARYHLHTAERLGAPAYQAALAEAQQGIAEAPTTAAQAIHGQASGDLKAFHGNTVDDGNIWMQFLTNRPDMSAGRALVELLRSRSDPRLAEYFDVVSTTNAVYAGADQFGVSPAGGASLLDGTTRRRFPFSQPLVTWAENQLTLAEARFQLGDAPAALGHVNAVRTAVGLPALASVTLQQIAEERYVALFQNVEVYSDWRRLCWPRLSPGGTPGNPAAEIPARLPYPINERNANPNIPAPNAAPTRNWNDPNACT